MPIAVNGDSNRATSFGPSKPDKPFGHIRSGYFDFVVQNRAMADNSERIAQIREILGCGATQTVTDGQTTVFDHASLRKELRDLMAEDDELRGRRPVISSMDLS